MAVVPRAARRRLPAVADRRRGRGARAGDRRPPLPVVVRPGRRPWRSVASGLHPFVGDRAGRCLGPRRRRGPPPSGDVIQRGGPRRRRARGADRAARHGRRPRHPGLAHPRPATRGREKERTAAARDPDPRRAPHALRLEPAPRIPDPRRGRDRRVLLEPAWIGGLRPRVQRGEPPRLGPRADARRARRRRLARQPTAWPTRSGSG